MLEHAILHRRRPLWRGPSMRSAAHESPRGGHAYVPPLVPLQWPAASFREPQSAFEERQAAEDSWTESTALLRDHACLPLKRP